jgi:hypothetical protein
VIAGSIRYITITRKRRRRNGRSGRETVHPLCLVGIVTTAHRLAGRIDQAAGAVRRAIAQQRGAAGAALAGLKLPQPNARPVLATTSTTSAATNSDPSVRQRRAPRQHVEEGAGDESSFERNPKVSVAKNTQNAK